MPRSGINARAATQFMPSKLMPRWKQKASTGILSRAHGQMLVQAATSGATRAPIADRELAARRDFLAARYFSVQQVRQEA
jgi:hypothetical protein